MQPERENSFIAPNPFAWQEEHYSKNTGSAFRAAIILSNISQTSLVAKYYGNLIATTQDLHIYLHGIILLFSALFPSLHLPKLVLTIHM